jgi:hypothetical protein
MSDINDDQERAAERMRDSICEGEDGPMSEVKPCPFCGSNDVRYNPMKLAIVCEGCGCEGPPVAGEDAHDEAKLCLTAWNTRPAPPAPSEAVREDRELTIALAWSKDDRRLWPEHFKRTGEALWTVGEAYRRLSAPKTACIHGVAPRTVQVSDCKECGKVSGGVAVMEAMSAPKSEEACNEEHRCEHRANCPPGKCADRDSCRHAPAPGLEESAKAVPMVLYCPAGHQHVDEGEWATRPHKTHQCQRVTPHGEGRFEKLPGEICGLEWRPASFPTVGVAALSPAPSKEKL